MFRKYAFKFEEIKKIWNFIYFAFWIVKSFKFLSKYYIFLNNINYAFYNLYIIQKANNVTFYFIFLVLNIIFNNDILIFYNYTNSHSKYNYDFENYNNILYYIN